MEKGTHSTDKLHNFLIYQLLRDVICCSFYISRKVTRRQSEQTYAVNFYRVIIVTTPKKTFTIAIRIKMVEYFCIFSWRFLEMFLYLSHYPRRQLWPIKKAIVVHISPTYIVDTENINHTFYQPTTQTCSSVIHSLHLIQSCHKDIIVTETELHYYYYCTRLTASFPGQPG